MNDNSDLIVNHLNVLHAHRGLIAAAYRQGSADISDDPANGRGLYMLNQIRVLVPFGEGTYRLASSFTRHLDETLNVDRLYSVVGADVIDLERRLPEIANLVVEAMFDGRAEDVDRYIDEFDRAVFALADSVTVALQFLRILADNKFANVSTLVEKRAQNEFYLERVKRISEALSSIHSVDLLHALEATPEGERMLQTYRTQIVNHLSSWRAQLLDITAILRDYLFRTRQIELLAKRMRAFELFLKRTPSYVPKDIEIFDTSPKWAMRAEGFSLKSHASVQNPMQEEILFEIGCTITSLARPNSYQTLPGILLPEESVEDEEDIRKPWQSAMEEFFDAVGEEPTSALAWKAARSDIGALDEDIWLLCLLHEEALQRNRIRTLRSEHIVETAEPLSGMIRVIDILFSREI